MSKTVTKAELQARCVDLEEQLSRSETKATRWIAERDETIRQLRAQLAELRAREDIAYHSAREKPMNAANAFGSRDGWHPWR